MLTNIRRTLDCVAISIVLSSDGEDKAYKHRLHLWWHTHKCTVTQ